MDQSNHVQDFERYMLSLHHIEIMIHLQKLASTPWHKVIIDNVSCVPVNNTNTNTQSDKDINKLRIRIRIVNENVKTHIHVHINECPIYTWKYGSLRCMSSVISNHNTQVHMYSAAAALAA